MRTFRSACLLIIVSGLLGFVFSVLGCQQLGAQLDKYSPQYAAQTSPTTQPADRIAQVADVIHQAAGNATIQAAVDPIPYGHLALDAVLGLSSLVLGIRGQQHKSRADAAEAKLSGSSPPPPKA